jgi:hypothetical protein
VSPAAPPAYAPKPPARRRRRFLIPLAALLGLCFVLAVAAALGYYFLWPRPETRPLVLINSPRHGEQVEVGQEVTVQSIARDEGKVTRVELWVDGQLQKSQTSNLPGGSSPFPLLARWQPSSPGTHTLIARAFNARGGRGQASVNVEAIELADRDGDGVPDEADACPDEPGPPAANGCPDRDGDGTPDAEDACPDEAGLPEGDGCPVSSERDRDGDGLFDEADACPDDPGPPRAEGCPDADADGVRDSEDACPDEPGLPEQDGCPTPGDLDSDGTPDAEDECPEEPGSAEHAGCPDGDGDGVRDRDDACPGEPGLPGHNGCPDSDGDGVPDPDDLRPEEPGGAGAGGAPDTGAGDRDGDAIPDDIDDCPDDFGPGPSGCPLDLEEEPEEGGVFPGMGDWGTVWTVEFQALEFEVFDDYEEVYCYASLADGDEDRYGPFDIGAEARHWNISSEFGSRFVPFEADSLRVHAECWAANIYTWVEETPGGIPGGGAWGTVWDLGSFVREHPRSDWDGHVITVESDPGPDGHSFEFQYRICEDSCEEAAFLAPRIQVGYNWRDEPWLAWRWDGDRSTIDGFNVYVNDNLVRTVGSDLYNIRAPTEPSCGQRLEYEMTAFSGHPFTPDRESPRSNTDIFEGEPCPRTVRVIFDGHTLTTHELYGVGAGGWGVTPIEGVLWANDQQIEFDGADMTWAGALLGFDLYSHHEYSIETDILHEIARWVDSCLGPGCPDYWAPWDNTLTTVLDADEDLTYGVRIFHVKKEIAGMILWIPLWKEGYEVTCEAEGTIPADELTPGLHTAYGYRCDLTVEIEELGP